MEVSILRFIKVMLLMALVVPVYAQDLIVSNDGGDCALYICANKALSGTFGKLAPWQSIGYNMALSGNHKIKSAWITTYYPQEGFWRGKGCRWGIGTSERVAAANLLPAKTFVWISNPPHLRQVWDTGSKRNDRVARSKQASLWIDLWVPFPGWKGLDTRVSEVFILSP
jgi:hypothetical protein